LRIDQLFLTTIQWIPFALAFLHTYLETGRPRDLRIAAVFLLLQILTSGHGAVFLVVSAIVLIGVRVVGGLSLARVARMPRDLGVGGWAAGAAVLVVFLLPYRSVQQEMGLRRTLDDWRPLHAVSFLAAPTIVQSFLLSRLAPLSRINETADAYLFP